MWALRKKDDALTPPDKNKLTDIFNQSINKGESYELV